MRKSVFISVAFAIVTATLVFSTPVTGGNSWTSSTSHSPTTTKTVSSRPSSAVHPLTPSLQSTTSQVYSKPHVLTPVTTTTTTSPPVTSGTTPSVAVVSPPPVQPTPQVVASPPATAITPPSAPAPAPTTANDGTSPADATQMAEWAKVNVCEEGGNWHVYGATYSGGLGFTHANWAQFNTFGYPADAADATPAQQVWVAVQFAIHYYGNPYWAPDQSGCGGGY